MEQKEIKPIGFDAKKFSVRLLEKKLQLEMNMRDMEKETGVSKSTISKIIQGSKPDIDTLIKLLYWIDADSFRQYGINPYVANELGLTGI